MPQLVQLLKPSHQKVQDLGGEIIAISQQTVADNLAITKANKLVYPNLSDVKADVIQKYDVLDFANVPKVSFFVIDKSGKIHWRSTHSGRDPNDLPQIDKLLDVVKKIQ